LKQKTKKKKKFKKSMEKGGARRAKMRQMPHL
jgi:hypothetical protein